MSFSVEEIKALQARLEETGASWTAGVTSLTDLAPDEVIAKLGYHPRDEEPSLMQREEDGKARLLEHESLEASMPSRTNWTNFNGRNFVTPVEDDWGGGSCVAFATCGAIEARVRVQCNIAEGEPLSNLLQTLSKAQLFYGGGGSSNPSGTGWDVPTALSYATNTGISAWWAFPYAGQNGPSGLANNWQDSLTILDSCTPLTNVLAMKQAIASKGPVITTFMVYRDFLTYKSGVYKRTSNKFKGEHCVTVVGFDDNLQAWYCKNSWGTAWGENGFFWIGYGQCEIDNTMWAPMTFKQIFPLNTQVFYIESQLSGYVVDIAGANSYPNAPLISYPVNQPPSLNQLWVWGSGGHLMSLLNGMVIDIQLASPIPGTPLITYPQNSPTSANQTWTLTSDGHLQSGYSPATFMDISGAYPGVAPIISFTKNVPNSLNQLWNLQALEIP